MKPTKDFIEGIVLEPLIKFIFNKLFPYIVITFILFIAIFLFAMLTFVMLFFKGNDGMSGTSMVHPIIDGHILGNYATIGACPFCSFSTNT